MVSPLVSLISGAAAPQGPHGLAAQGLQPRFAAHGLQPFFAAQGLQPRFAEHGLQPFLAAQGLQPRFAAQGLQPRFAAQGFALARRGTTHLLLYEAAPEAQGLQGLQPRAPQGLSLIHISEPTRPY